MLVPGPPFNASPYHLSAMAARIPTPEDLSRSNNTKALDLLQHHANQYYNSHKIHELSERALKSPTSNTKVSVSSPSALQPGVVGPSNTIVDRVGSGVPSGQSPASSSLGPSVVNNPLGGQSKNLDKPLSEVAPGSKEGLPSTDIKDVTGGRSPPPQRHVHTHHHTHVGLGYPIGPYGAPYGGKLLVF